MGETLVTAFSNLVTENSGILWALGAILILVNSIDYLIAQALKIVSDKFSDKFDSFEYVGLEGEIDNIDSEIERLQETLDPALKKQRLQDELDDLLARREELWDEMMTLHEDYNA